MTYASTFSTCFNESLQNNEELPEKQMPIDFISKNVIFLLIQTDAILKLIPFFDLISSAKHEYNFLHSRRIPPAANVTSGVNLPCLISIIRWLCNFFFSLSLSLYVYEMSWLTYLLAFELKTLTLENATWNVDQESLL